MSGRRVVRAAVAFTVAALALLAAAPRAQAQPVRPRWDTRVLATVPSPGYPAFAYVHPDGNVYEGTYDDPRGDTIASKILEYSPTGTLLKSWTVPGQNVSGSHGTQVATSDAHGDLVLLDLSPARALRLDRATGRFTPYSTFADLPACAPETTAPGCTPTLRDQPPEPDYAVWGDDGGLYVTDYQQALIWRVPPGGGAATVWFSDRRLDGDLFGTAGLLMAPDHHSLLITQGSSIGLAAGNPGTGRLYRLAIQPDGHPGALTQLWESRFGDLPDGFAMAQSGDLYIALVGLPNQLVELSPTFQELERFPSTPFTGANGSPEPFDNPSSAKFLGTRLIVPNQSYITGNPSHWTLLDVETQEAGMPEFIPAAAGGVAAAVAGAAGGSTSPVPAAPTGLANTSAASSIGGAGSAAAGLAMLVAGGARRRRRGLARA